MSVGQENRDPRMASEASPGPALPVPAGGSDDEPGKNRRRRGKGGVRPAGDELPTRTRSYGSMVLGVALVVGCGLAGALYLNQAGNTESVLAVSHPVAKGETLERSDLYSVDVAGIDGSFAVDDLSTVEGMTASVDLVDGQVLTEQQVSDEPLPAAGQAIVGISLEAPQTPGDGLAAGDLVRVVGVKGSNSDTSEVGKPEVLADSAEVYRVTTDATQTDRVMVSIDVADGDADAIAAYAAAGQVSLVEISAAEGGD